ncbi:MAG: winged helix-turn-helix domain-containing protein [Myxococcales bacterium FL481]|nr:MAG: winged helix-turn-helix domain-containing protein [Myxococcales bacterium FL481]
MRSGPWNMSASVARRLALGAQGFADRRPHRAVDRRHLRRVMRRLEVLQLDSIPVVIRTQYLPFHSRLGPYATELLDRIAYRDDEWFEAWAHEASLLPVGTEPLFRWRKQRARAGDTWKALHEFATRETAYVQRVLDEVRARGVVTAGGLSDPRPQPSHSGWGGRSLGALALDWLFRVGELGIRRGGNFEKHFSPLASIVPQAILTTPTPTVEEALRALTQRSVRALGVGTATDVADYFRLPIREVRSTLVDLVRDGDVVEATVPGWKHPAFADPAASIPRKIEGATVLAPFDPMVWNRDRARRIFNFEYKIEIYVPQTKRRWGYYVLPILVDGHIVARLDAKTDRDEGVLRIKAAHAEAGRNDAATADLVAEAVRDLARLVEVERIEVSRMGDIASRLRRALA